MLLGVREREGDRLPARGLIGGAMAAMLSLALAAPAAAQQTRAETIAQKQAEKATQLTPYQPTRVENFLNRLEENLASPPNGFYPAFGNVYPGGGLTLGAGYRQFYSRKAVWDIVGLYSVRHYKQIEVGTRSPWNYDGRWIYGVRGGWFDAPQIGFYGLGMGTETANRANFRLSESYVAGMLGVRPSSWTRLEVEAGIDDYSTDAGRGLAPSIETRYDESLVPGLFSNPTYLRTQATAAIDWRTSPGYSRKGGYYGLTLVNYGDRDDTYSFRRLDGEVIQHVPLLRENWVISVRGRVQTTLDDDDVVPYFLLPSLGSGRTLRAYSTGRFRDRHSLLTSAEFRWIPNRLGLDMALFYDAGKVTARRGDLDFGGLTSNWGIGARFHGPTSTVLRIEAARGLEGWHLVFTTNAAF